MNKVTKAIIPVAGRGTRRLPITKTIEKCMLPICNRPIVDYTVEDCIKAGITDIYFVISEDSVQIKHYYSQDKGLEEYLIANGKNDKLSMITPPENVNFHYIIQPAKGKYGTAVPVELAADYINDGESALVLMGDDFLYNSDDSSDIKRLVELTDDGECGLLATRVELTPGGTFGLIVTDKDGYYKEIVDQPLVEDNPPSDIINISKYVLTKEVFEIARNLPSCYNGEYQLPDAINEFVKKNGKTKVTIAEGEYLDGGNLDGWLHANEVVAKGLKK